MRDIPPGASARHDLVVTEAMTVDFEDRYDPRLGRLHPVYATYWLVKHMELVGRKLVLPFLEDDEEGIGHAVSVRHTASALPGMRVSLRASLERVEGNRVYVSCVATSELGDTVGEGETVQVVLKRAVIEAGFARLRRRWGADVVEEGAPPRGPADEQV